MAKAAEVLNFLLPNGGWTIVGEDFSTITYDDGVAPVTKKQFDDGFALVDQAKASADAAKETAKQAILDKLGLTAEEAATLLS